MTLYDFIPANSPVKIEISETDLHKLAAYLIAYGERKAQGANKITPMLTIEEVCDIVKRDRSTLARWHKNKILTHNTLGLYSQEEVLELIKK